MDILNVMFLPKYSKYRFRYRLQHLSQELNKNPFSLIGMYALIVLYREASEVKTLRKIKVLDVETAAGFIYITFQNLDFYDYLTTNNTHDLATIMNNSVASMTSTKGAYVYLTDLPSLQISAAFNSKIDEERNWSAITNALAEFEDFERVVFLKLRRLLDSNSQEVHIQPTSGSYRIRGSNTYELEIVQTISEKSKDRTIIEKGVAVTACAVESHIKFISGEAVILGRYDILKIDFRTLKRSRRAKSFITLTGDKSQLQQAVNDKTKVPSGMAEPKIELTIDLSQEIFWILPIIGAGLFLAAFGGAYAGKDFDSMKAMLGGIFSAGGALLSAYLGLRFLSEE